MKDVEEELALCKKALKQAILDYLNDVSGLRGAELKKTALEWEKQYLQEAKK